MYTSYREPLCTIDERGVKYYSPLCNVDSTKVTVADTRQTHQMFPPDVGCKMKPLRKPSPQVPQFNDAPSAHDWFKDPTYAQRMIAKKANVPESVIESNPSLQMYHRMKTMERVAGSIMQTL